MPSTNQLSSLTTVYIGCNVCSANSIPIVYLDTTFGYYYQECQSTQNFDLTVENAPCPTSGEILRWDGYFIKEEQQLKCTPCSQIIPNCLVCTSDMECTVC